jgi:hypothetical protein
MNANTTNPEKLWPILPRDDRFPFTPGMWTFLNIVFAAFVAMPFLIVAGSAAMCLWLVEAARTLVEAYAGGGTVLPVIATALKVIIILFASRMLYLFVAVGGITYMIREARDGLREFDPNRL